jgi:hypothetical protein
MSPAATSFGDLLEQFGQGWNRFWFTPADPLPCAIIRLLTGLLAALYLADQTASLSLWYAPDGLLTPEVVDRLLEITSGGQPQYHFSYLRYLQGPWLLAAHGLAICAALALAAGWWTRTSNVLTLLAVLAYVHRAPQVAGHVEPLLAMLLAYLLLAPAGRCCSLDAWWRGRRAAAASNPAVTSAGEADGCSASVAANVSLRLIQVHLAMFTAMMGLTKLYGDAWWDGSALWVLLAQTESRPWDLTGLRQAGDLGEYLLNAWSHLVVAFELTLPVLIWNRGARLIVRPLAVLVWGSLVLATGLVLLALALGTALIAFVSADELRGWWGGRRPAGEG